MSSAIIDQVRRNLQAADERERERLEKLVEEANREVNERAAERHAAREQAEQDKQADIARFWSERDTQQRQDTLKRYLAFGGQPEAFDAWYQEELNRQARDREAGIAHHYRKSF